MTGGIIVLHPVDGYPLYVNPIMINYFGPSHPKFLEAIMGPKQDGSLHKPAGPSTVVIGNAFFQVKETDKDIISAITRLRKRAEDSAIALRKRLDRDDYLGDEEEEAEI